MRRLIVIPIAILALSTFPPLVSAQDLDDQVYMLIARGCRASAKAFVQTAFRTAVEGSMGLVTALHGVLGCTTIIAQRNHGQTYVDDLRLTKVDVNRDVAFFVSAKLGADTTPFLRGTGQALNVELRVVGYPNAVPTQIAHASHFLAQPSRLLQDVLPPGLLQRFAQRNSPAVTAGILLVDAPLQAGYSGAPMLTMPSRQVMGVANGGIEGGLSHINWVIPFTDIEWVDVSQVAGRLETLGNADTSDLFASAFGPKVIPTLPDGGATISGRVMYAGRPVASFKPADAVIELMDVESREFVPADVQYDRRTGTFEITRVPPGKFTPFVRVETGYPFHAESGGDFFSRLSGLNDDIVVAPYEESLRRDLEVVQVIHVTKPVDNQTIRTSTDDPPELLYQSFYAPSAEVFTWDPVPGAAYYEAWILLQERGTERRLDTKSYRVTTPSISPQLAVTPDNAHYMFMVNAYDSTGRLIGVFTNYYRNGSGGWFEFSVLSAPRG